MTPSDPLLAVNIRPMTLDDLADVVALDAISFNLPWPERSFRYELTQNPNASAWVAEVTAADGSQRIAGMIVVWLIIDEAHIGTIAVHPDFRHRGIGQKLLAHTLLVCHARGALSAFLEVRRSNLGAQALYRRFGFEVIGERRRYYHDNGEDALLMGLTGLNEEHLHLWYGG
jgi:[ribosomal protein S18]-alanine N-acetyltransferase